MWRKITLAVAIVVFCVSVYQLVDMYMENQKASSEYEKLEQNIEKTEDQFIVDFEELSQINEEVVAWIRFENPEEISYPVLYSGDNSKYLSETFQGTKHAAGALFVDRQNQTNFTDRNTFIHGHNMKDGSMFGKLMKYKEQSFWEENPYFYIYLPDGTQHKYQIFAVEIVEETSDSYQYQYGGDSFFEEYIEMIRGRALYETGVSVAAGQKIVSLSTCTNITETQRMLVHGVEVEVCDAK